jgi:nitroreductase
MSANPQAFAFLANRQSEVAKVFSLPVPDRDELVEILQAASRVPDHGKLEPWRLVVIEAPAMARIAGLAEAHARAVGADAQATDKARGQFDRGHLAVVVISSPKATEKVPLAEQILSAGALCLGVVNAASAKGWGANWLSGWPSHDAAFIARAFDCTPGETVAGIIHIGTPTSPAPDRPRPDLAKIVSWLSA